MIDIAPEAVITVPALGNEAVDIGVPFQISAKGMGYHDKAGSEIHGFILFEKHAGNNTVHGVKETVKQCPVIQEKLPEVLVNGKNTVPGGWCGYFIRFSILVVGLKAFLPVFSNTIFLHFLQACILRPFLISVPFIMFALSLFL